MLDVDMLQDLQMILDMCHGRIYSMAAFLLPSLPANPAIS